uniref:HR-29-like protein n=1 Tax=Ciona intestinalis TaxID=7719 RepID=Q95P27_CIOIN|nr:HR-29-like protein [Ciona intestinalis]
MALMARDFDQPWSMYPAMSRFGDFPSRNWNYGDESWPLMRRNRPMSSWMMESTKRFMEMEKRFDQFMSRVDGRFRGMLRMIDFDDEVDASLKIPVEHDGAKMAVEKAPLNTNGRYKININVQDFKPEEVTVKVAGGKVEVHAKRESKNEDNGMYAYTFREFRRAFTLPDGMKTEDVTSSLTDDGILKIEGPHDVAIEQLKKPTLAIGEIPISVQHGN